MALKLFRRKSNKAAKELKEEAKVEVVKKVLEVRWFVEPRVCPIAHQWRSSLDEQNDWDLR
jgi:hypothetical protein